MTEKLLALEQISRIASQCKDEIFPQNRYIDANYFVTCFLSRFYEKLKDEIKFWKEFEENNSKNIKD